MVWMHTDKNCLITKTFVRQFLFDRKVCPVKQNAPRQSPV